MKKIKLNEHMGEVVARHGYELDPTEQYVITLSDEMDTQTSIIGAVQTMGLEALSDFHNWLDSNGFSVMIPDPTNEFVADYYGVKPLWKTNLSQGIVVKNTEDDDYYIVLECSNENEGFKYTQIIVTLGGCM